LVPVQFWMLTADFVLLLLRAGGQQAGRAQGEDHRHSGGVFGHGFFPF